MFFYKVNHKGYKIQRKNKYKSRQDQILKSDNSFAKSFIAPYTPKKCCYSYITVVYVFRVYVRNVSIIV